jgi:glucokinase
MVKKGASTKLFEIMERHGRTRLQSGIWERALKHDDKLATKLIDRAVAALGAGIGSAVNLLDVEAVVIGGGLGTRLGPQYAERIADAMEPHLFASERPPAVKSAALGDLGGAIGASLLAG